MGWMHSLRSSSLRWFLFPLLVGRSLFSQTLLSPKKASNDPKIPNFFARLTLLLHFRTFSILKNVSGRELPPMGDASVPTPQRTSPAPTNVTIIRYSILFY